MRSFYLSFAALLLSAPALAQTAPAAPFLTAGTELEGLRFDWETVPGATWYELEYRANQTGAFVQLGSDLAASTTTYAYRFPLHLFNWTYARYRLAACNPSGCSRSPEVSASNLRRHAVGYFKAAFPASGDQLGDEVDISSSGTLMVAAQPGSLNSTGGLTEPPGSIIFYRRAATFGFGWVEQAKLFPPVPPFIEGKNQMNVGIANDAEVLVLGMPNYFHEEFDEQSGEVFVFKVNLSLSRWERTRLLSGSRGTFGRWVGINDAANIIAVGTGEGLPGGTPRQVIMYRFANGQWTVVRGIGNRPGLNEGCSDFGAMSRDGSTVVESCAERDSNGETLRRYIRVHTGPNWTQRHDLPMEMTAPGTQGYGVSDVTVDATGDTIAASISVSNNPVPVNGAAEVHVFKRSAGVYSKVATLTPGSWRSPENRNFFGFGLALSGDGKTLAVGDSWDNGTGLGVRAAPLTAGTARTGAVYVFRLSTTWWLANVIKPNVTDDSRTFGRTVDLNGSGLSLIIGYPNEGSNASGIGGNWSGTGSPNSGAVFMY